jgi:hypothetical protein
MIRKNANTSCVYLCRRYVNSQATDQEVGTYNMMSTNTLLVAVKERKIIGLNKYIHTAVIWFITVIG